MAHSLSLPDCRTRDRHARGRRSLLCALGSVLMLLAPALAPTRASAAPLAVEVTNQSEPVLCAEKDNVALAFSSTQVRQFRIEAVHPAYIGALVADRTAPDWTQCDMAGDPSFPAAPQRVTVFRSPDLWLMGFTFPAFWRPASVPVRVGSETFTGLHMMQLWVRTLRGPYEALVVYPPDGYWRARPLPPAHMAEAAYGSSFLLGPVETEGRPLVKFKEIVFDPATRSFALSFADGSSGRLRVAELDAERMVLDATLDGAVAGRPFAALRSMYITQFNADVAQVAWKAEGAKGWQESGIMAFPGGAVLDLWAGRLTPSRHNSSAPDMVFGPFSGPAK